MIPTASDFPDVPAVVLLDRGELVLTVDPKRLIPIGRLRRYRRIEILRESGLSRARIEVPYDPETGVLGLIARTVLPDGSILDADPDNITDTPYPDGRRAKAIVAPGVVPGAVVEYTYDLYRDDLRFIAPWVFQADIPTVRSEYAVAVPHGYQVDLRYSEKGDFVDRPPERFDIDDGTRFSWSLSNLPALFVEEGMPSKELLAPRAHVVFVSGKIRARTFEGFGSWDQVGKWFLSRMPNYLEISDDTKAEARRVAGDASDEEKALKIMEVLARDLPDQPGAIAPLYRTPLVHPDAVLRQKRANPTTRGLLFVALLRASGVNAMPALFAHRDQDVLLPDLPTVRALDGVAAVIPREQGPLILDPSQRTLSADVPSPRLQGTRVIQLVNDVAEVLRVPTSAPKDSRTTMSFDLTIDKRGDLFGNVEARLTGAEAGALREQLADAKPEDYAEIVSSFLRVRGAGLGVESVNIADRTALRRPLVLEGTVALPKLITGEATDIDLRLGRFIGSSVQELREVRRTPITLSAPSEVEVRVTLTMPEEWSHAELPPVATESWDGGQVELSVRSETSRRIGMFRKSTVEARRIDPKSYSRFRRFHERVRIAEDARVLVTRPPPRQLEY
ncbi:MAG: DUF3857 domain-containing protein [Deltaproteobacteria bacterium]